MTEMCPGQLAPVIRTLLILPRQPEKGIKSMSRNMLWTCNLTHRLHGARIRDRDIGIPDELEIVPLLKMNSTK